MKKPDKNIGTITVGKTKLTYVINRSSKRKRTVALAIGPEPTLQVTAPVDTTIKAIESILSRRKTWVVQKLALLCEGKQQAALPELISGTNLSFWGKQYRLKVTRKKKQERGCVLQDGFLVVNIPEEWTSAEIVAQEVRLELVSWYKKQARQKLKSRLDRLSKKFGLSYGSFMIRSPGKRWGSCDPKNNIRLNWRIVMAPLSLIDYVIVHELCHTVHKDHSDAFWRLLGNHMPDYDRRKEQLKKLGAGYQRLG